MPKKYLVKMLPRVTANEARSLRTRVAELRVTGGLKKAPQVQYEFDWSNPRRGIRVRGKERS